MGIDELIDQTFPSLPPHPHRGSTSSNSYSTSNVPLTPPRVQRPAPSYSVYGIHERGSMSAKDQDGMRESEREASTSRTASSRDSYARDLNSPQNRPVSQIPSSPASKLKSFFRSSSSNKINDPTDKAAPHQSTSNPSFASPSSYSTRSRTTTSSSNRTFIPTSDSYSSPPPSSSSKRTPSTPAPRNRMSILESSLPISPATRGDSDHVGKAPSRPVTPSSSTRADGQSRKKERTRSGKNLSIWSLSPSVLGGGGSSAASISSKQSQVEGDDGASIASRSRQGSIITNRPRPQSSLSCVSAVSPPSPPLQAHLFRPSTPQRHSTYSISSPATARPSLSPSHSANSIHSQNRSRSLSTSTSSSLTPNPTPPRLRKKPSLGETAMKAITSLMIRNPQSTLSSCDSRHRAGSGGVGVGENEREELTEEELLSWKRNKNIGLSVSSMEKLGCYDLEEGEGDGFGSERRRRKSSNRSFLGNGGNEGIGLGMMDTKDREEEGESNSDDDELLIIDRTKSKGFSTLLGGSYDEFVPSFSTPPTTTTTTFLLPSTAADVSPTSQPTSQFASPATLRPPTSKAQKRLSQNSTNSSVGSDEALWLDASNTNSFPSSPLAPKDPTTPQPGEKEIKRSAFSESLTHPSPIPTPPSPARRRRSSMIPLSPKIAQEQAIASSLENGVEEVWTTLPVELSPHLLRPERIEFTPPPSPPMSEREQGGAIDGVFKKDPYL